MRPLSRISARGATSAGSSPPGTGSPSYRAASSTRQPCSAQPSTVSRYSSNRRARMNSGAPTRNAPCPANTAPLHLVSGEKGMRFSQTQSVSPSNSS